ncbi:MAG: RNase adapter RapZ [Longicatena sp.]|nr:RNase adapter RapZ [Longicatena sp.]
MQERNIVLITGMSGAGKTSAMGILEDMGYHCIDNFPVQVIDSLENILKDDSDPRYQNVALATTALDYPKFIQYFKNMDVKVHVVFLDASNEQLLIRYKFTRRNHPMILMSKARTLEEAIEIERDMFNAIIEQTVIRIDTTKIDTSKLKTILMEKLALDNKRTFSISFMSFGYKHGVPMDPDFIIDVRFLPNPFYIEELRSKTGNDREVYDYVIKASQTQDYIRHIKAMLDYVFMQYRMQNKNHLMIAIGCTGGQHRSVSIANWLYRHYSDQYQCFISHRDARVGS